MPQSVHDLFEAIKARVWPEDDRTRASALCLHVRDDWTRLEVETTAYGRTFRLTFAEIPASDVPHQLEPRVLEASEWVREKHAAAPLYSPEPVAEREYDDLTLTEVKARGWSGRLIECVLGPPDKEKRNPHYASAAPMKLWSRTRVEAAEASSPAFIAYQRKRAQQRLVR